MTTVSNHHNSSHIALTKVLYSDIMKTNSILKPRLMINERFTLSTMHHMYYKNHFAFVFQYSNIQCINSKIHPLILKDSKWIKVDGPHSPHLVGWVVGCHQSLDGVLSRVPFRSLGHPGSMHWQRRKGFTTLFLHLTFAFFMYVLKNCSDQWPPAKTHKLKFLRKVNNSVSH